MDSTKGSTVSQAPSASTIGATISDVAAELALYEWDAGNKETPLTRRLIGAGVAFELLMSVALVARALAHPGCERDAALMADLRHVLNQAEPVMAEEHYSRLVREAQNAAQKVAA